jgi:hypothetical protein
MFSRLEEQTTVLSSNLDSYCRGQVWMEFRPTFLAYPRVSYWSSKRLRKDGKLLIDWQRLGLT